MSGSRQNLERQARRALMRATCKAMKERLRHHAVWCKRGDKRFAVVRGYRPIRRLDQLGSASQPAQAQLEKMLQGVLISLHEGSAGRAEVHWLELVKMLLDVKDVQAKARAIRIDCAEAVAVVGLVHWAVEAWECLVCEGYPESALELLQGTIDGY